MNFLEMNPSELYKYVKQEIKYGFVDTFGNKYYPNDFEHVDIDKLYILQSPHDTLKNKCAWCWDVVELYRYYFNSNNIPNNTYYLEYKNDDLDIHQTHTFILYSLNGKWYNIEDNSSNNENGIFEYNSEIDAINTISFYFKEYIKNTFNEVLSDEFYICNKYIKPSYHISSIEFQNWCKNTR